MSPIARACALVGVGVVIGYCIPRLRLARPPEPTGPTVAPTPTQGVARPRNDAWGIAEEDLSQVFMIRVNARNDRELRLALDELREYGIATAKGYLQSALEDALPDETIRIDDTFLVRCFEGHGAYYDVSGHTLERAVPDGGRLRIIQPREFTAEFLRRYDDGRWQVYFLRVGDVGQDPLPGYNRDINDGLPGVIWPSNQAN